MKTVVITGAGCDVGSALSGALLSDRIHLVLVDSMPESHLLGMIGRLMIDRQLQQLPMYAKVTVKGDTDFHNIEEMADFFREFHPDIVVNYAKAQNWDDTLLNAQFPGIQRAGFGGFAAIQALTPMLIGQALHRAGIKPHFVVGNLPDMTIPLLHASSQWKPLVKPVCGAGSVGLIEFALLSELKTNPDYRHAPLNVDLVAHHVHWEASRAREIKQNVPFLLRIKFDEQDITRAIGDPRVFMNRAIANSYEPGAGFASTAGLLARRVIKALLNDNLMTRMHLPSPNGLGVGMPCLVSSQGVEVDLPKEWDFDAVQEVKVAAQKSDGVERLLKGGAVKFTLFTRKAIKEKMGFSLPEQISPIDFFDIANAQMACFSR